MPAHFVVIEHEGTVIGCGGYTSDGELVLGTIRPDLRGQGLGRFLLLARSSGVTQIRPMMVT